ncbi:unnamed protein product [Heligmosomoides polygyrus]|uniref:CCDC50_N domain-containing protein n=1 Tax=Heligmosomoides polygyrus TaxID=6339 RepID=A0A183FNZ6_HELPZ|nr:unnamed protein product [Heligmosomoides polygyrus]
MADGDTMKDEFEPEFRRLCGGTQTSTMAEVSKRWRTGNHDRETIEVVGQQYMEQSETIQRQQAELQEFRRRCREQDEELRRLRQKSVEAPSPAEGEWIRQLCQQEGIDPMQEQAEFTTAWTCEEEGRLEVLPHPPYSPDLAPLDYHLFRALNQHLKDRCFNDRTELESEVEHFFE